MQAMHTLITSIVSVVYLFFSNKIILHYWKEIAVFKNEDLKQTKSEWDSATFPWEIAVFLLLMIAQIRCMIVLVQPVYCFLHILVALDVCQTYK